MNTFHEPVMLGEVLEALHIEKGKSYIDATLGGGGYTEGILGLGGTVLGLDQDQDAISFVKTRLASFIRDEHSPLIVVQTNFEHIAGVAQTNGFGRVDGIVFDLGVSSHHLNTPERGFSYRFKDALLDMRMNRSTGVSAKDVIAQSTEEELYELFSKYGEEQRSGALAHAIVSTRKIKPIETTEDLYEVIGSVARNKIMQPAVASRIFQALRIYVNDELGVLRRGLEGAWSLLKPEGKLVVVSFHSLEDRIVKQFMREHTRGIDPKKSLVPTLQEQQRNSRSRSAKLRVLTK